MKTLVKWFLYFMAICIVLALIISLGLFVLGIGLIVWAVKIHLKNKQIGVRSKAPAMISVLGVLIFFSQFYVNSVVFKEDTVPVAGEEQKTSTSAQTTQVATIEEPKSESEPVKEEPANVEAAASVATPTPKVKVEKEVPKQATVKGINGIVTRVVDGDTIEVKLSDTGKVEDIRMILVDTPETKHPRLGVQPFGKEASKFTTDQLSGKNVVLEKDLTERDKYGRVLAYVWVDGVNFNKRLIEQGYARLAVYQPDVKHLDEFRAAQTKAQKTGKGIWSIEDYVLEDGYNTPEKKKEVAKKEEPKAAVSKVEEKPKDRGSCNIKGNQSGIYHVPGGQYYEVTKAEEMFCSTAEAEAAGYRASKK
ncbi:thermonuclease family protein [Metabacillus sp. KIGAM252]|uniref:Thermonuclease family protein n=1 Tax=Metabacillus flavus TaxID=2823519 RepID=A0ABS5LHZ7_9BACI|nr:thermonuclease family protein [Metabacillus flavus]MBS2970375.1 thermonuclease family protein [Metabacillus flavus]